MTDKSFYYVLLAIVFASGLISNAAVLITGVAV